MASMARSGETLLLKLMNAHDRVVIVHNLSEQDTVYKNKAFEFFKTFYINKISKKHKIVKPYKLKGNQVLLLKQGVWKHKKPFMGFILSRNPVSIYASLKAYDKLHPEYDSENNFWFENSKRLERWMNDMEPEKTAWISKQNPIDQFCSFYNIRMNDLHSTGLPIIRYEDLLTDTQEVLQKICATLNIEMDDAMLKSHEQYESGAVGHGQNDLSKPIDTSSLFKYKKNVTQEEFEIIKEKTQVVHEKFGYELKESEVFCKQL
jgi:hypothetical protein